MAKKGERKYPCNCGDGGCWKCWPSNLTKKALAEEKRTEDQKRERDGKDDGRGVSSEPWESIRHRLITLASSLTQAGPKKESK